MNNLISVTQRGPDILERVREIIGTPVGQEVVGGVRKAGALLKNNPYSLVLNDLIFPPALADGTLKGVINRHGYEAAPSQVYTGPPESYKYKRDETSGLLGIDPEIERAIKNEKTKLDAGISGTFVPVEY